MSRLPQAILLAPTDGGLALARSLRRRGVAVRILGERRGPWGWVTRTRWAQALPAGQLPAASADWLSRLQDLARQGEGVLIPGTDRTCEFLVRERSQIPEELRSFEGGESAHRKMMDKRLTYELADQVGVRYPWTLRLGSRGELDQVADEARYPCLLKPTISHEWRRLIGERRVLPLAGPDDLVREAGPALDAGLELLVTERVPGPDENLEAAVLIRLEDGSYPLRYGRLKVRMYPPGYGAGSIHESAEVPETMELIIRLLDAAGFVGVCNGEVKRHEETGERVLIEVNGRLPQGWGLADAAGTDGSWRVYATLAGLPLPPQPPQVPGVRVIVPSLEPRAIVANLRERRTTLREILSSYRGVRSWSGLSIGDPAPALSLLGGQLGAAARFLGRQIRRSAT